MPSFRQRRKRVEHLNDGIALVINADRAGRPRGVEETYRALEWDLRVHRIFQNRQRRPSRLLWNVPPWESNAGFEQFTPQTTCDALATPLNLLI